MIYILIYNDSGTIKTQCFDDLEKCFIEKNKLLNPLLIDLYNNETGEVKRLWERIES